MNINDGYCFYQTWKETDINCSACHKKNVVHQYHEFSQENLTEDHYKCISCNKKWIISGTIH